MVKAKEAYVENFQLIAVAHLNPSPTNPRKRFPEASLKELAESIKEHGLLQHILVRAGSLETDRPVTNKKGEVVDFEKETVYEIVCGERRYRAAKLAGLKEIPCTIRDLTDEQVLDMQIHENLHREEVHPLEEAVAYESLMNTLKGGIDEVALRVGKDKRFVAGRLKLNNLIEEAKEDLENGHLPLTHAMEIAKFGPNSQKELLINAYKGDTTWNEERREWEYIPLKDEPETFRDFLEWINENVLFKLSSVKFDTKATNLREDGLSCTACPNRTGANAALFDNDLLGKNDSCLDHLCFNQKKENHVVLLHAKLAHEQDIDVKTLPYFDSGAYSDREGVLGYNSAIQIVEKDPDYSQSKKKCTGSIQTVNLSGRSYGELVTICPKGNGCKVHRGTQTVGSKASKITAEASEAEKERKLIRKEEIFDMQVASLVRLRVLRQAADKFANTFTIAGSPISNEEFLTSLLTRLWVSANDTYLNAVHKDVKDLMRQIVDDERAFTFPAGTQWMEIFENWTTTKEIAKLSDRNKRLMLFLFVEGNKGVICFDRYVSQAGIKALADAYNLNYTLMDAQARVEVAEQKRKKHVELYKTYLASVEAGKKAKIPRPVCDKWEPKD